MTPDVGVTVTWRVPCGCTADATAEGGRMDEGEREEGDWREGGVREEGV